MNRTSPQQPEADTEARELRQAPADALALLHKVRDDLQTVLREEYLREETPIEVWVPLESAVETIGAILRRLDAANPVQQPQLGHTADCPTPRQAQFLAYISEYMRQSPGGVAPTHAALQRFFGLTPPSVNSMLIRLEQRGFIRRTPGVARAIDLVIDSALIPPLEQPFRL
jgi:repressor LexA